MTLKPRIGSTWGTRMRRANIYLAFLTLIVAGLAMRWAAPPQLAEGRTPTHVLAIVAPLVTVIQDEPEPFPLPRPYCRGDVTADDTVNVLDLLLLIQNWGQICVTGDCPVYVDHWPVVDVRDLLILLGQWGSCPTYDEDLLATLTMIREKTDLFRELHPETFAAWDPPADGWDIMIELGYLDEVPVNPITGRTSIKGYSDLQGAWVWRLDSYISQEWGFYAVNLIGTEYDEAWVPNWGSNWG